MYKYKIVYVYKPPLVKHKMLLLPSGFVIHNTPIKGIVIEPLCQAITDREVQVSKTIYSRFSETELTEMAELLANNKKYGLFYNCEHFLNELLGLPIKSNQLKVGLFFGFAAFKILSSR